MTVPSPKVIGKLVGTSYERQQLHRDLEEKVLRECEALRMYAPQAHQNALHSSRVRTLVMQKGNQVGGTLCGAAEVARAVTAQDPHNKYPKRDGVVCILGYGERHIGDVFWPKLFKAGAFDIIKDKETKRWRTFRPWPQEQGGDQGREDEMKPAPPLIPPRFLVGEPAWVSKKDRIFSKVTLTTGWELRAYNSAGDPGQAQGFLADLYWVDEDTATTGWIEEVLFRLIKKRGLLRWTAKPHGKNDEMLKLLDQAEQESKSEKPNTIVIRATLYDNKYIGSETLAETVATAKAMGEDVYQERVLGNLSLTSMLMYPTFSRRLHDVMGGQELQSPAQKLLAERMGEPPDDWCRYAFTDPGSQTCAIEFIAVPPPELGDQIFVYDECYLKDATSWHFGEAMQFKVRDRVMQAFYIDFHGGKLRGIASGDVPIDKYRDALQERGIKSVATGHGFHPGCDDIKRREEEMRLALSLTRDNWPRLMVVAGKCPMFCMEMERFKKKTVRHGQQDIPLDEGNRKGFTHAIECVEMAVGNGLPYVKPRPQTVDHSWIDKAKSFTQRQKERLKKSRQFLGGKPFISLGPQGVRS